jgi:hypothetical protein
VAVEPPEDIARDNAALPAVDAPVVAPPTAAPQAAAPPGAADESVDRRSARVSESDGASRASRRDSVPVVPPAAEAPAMPPPMRPAFAALRPDGGGGCRIAEASARGITLAQLRALLALGEALCAREGWTAAAGGPALDPKTLDVYQLVARVIEPATREARCSLVELVADGPQPPHVAVTHWWGQPVGDLVRCFEQLCVDLGLDAETTCFWLGACALNARDLALSAGGLEAGPFARALLLADCALSVVDAEGAFFTRYARAALARPPPPIERARARAVRSHPARARPSASGVRLSPRAPGWLTPSPRHTLAPAAAPPAPHRSTWCAYETYAALVDAPAGCAHHVATASASLAPVCLLEGFAQQDEESSAHKDEREADFPRALLAKARGLSLAASAASRADDKAAIVAAVGADAAALEATLRVRFLARALAARATPDAEHAALVLDLRCSRVRSLALRFDDDALDGASAARARALADALPRSLADAHFERAHPALVKSVGVGSNELARSGALRALGLTECNVIEALRTGVLAAAFARGALLRLSLRCARRELRVGCWRQGHSVLRARTPAGVREPAEHPACLVLPPCRRPSSTAHSSGAPLTSRARAALARPGRCPVRARRAQIQQLGREWRHGARPRAAAHVAAAASRHQVRVAAARAARSSPAARAARTPALAARSRSCGRRPRAFRPPFARTRPALLALAPSPSARRGNSLGREGGAALARSVRCLPKLLTLDLGCARPWTRWEAGTVVRLASIVAHRLPL